MAQISGVVWDPPEAAELRALESYINDLIGADRYLQIAEDALNSRDERIQYLEPLLITGIIKYGRVFGKGRRRPNPSKFLMSLSKDSKDIHDLVIFYRNQCIAHAVAESERVHVTIQTRIEENGTRSMMGLSTAGTSVLVMSSLKEIVMVRSLISELLSFIHCEIEFERSKLIDLAKSLTDSELDALSPPGVQQLDLSKNWGGR
jgi:hypothetical protein